MSVIIILIILSNSQYTLAASDAEYAQYIDRAKAAEPDRGGQYQEFVKLYNSMIQNYQNSKYNEAIANGTQAIQLIDNFSGRKLYPQQLGTCINNLADIHIRIGNYEEARRLYDKLLLLYEEIYGSNNTKTVFIYNNIGWIEHSRGNYDLAISYYEIGLKLNTSIYGEQNKSVAVNLNNIAKSLCMKGDFKRSRFYYERAIPIYEREVGLKDQGTITMRNNYAEVLRELGEFSAARDILNQNLSIAEVNAGVNSESYITALSGIGYLENSLGNYEKGRIICERSLQLLEKFYHANHPQVAVHLNHCAAMAREQGDFSTAKEYYDRSLKITEKAYGTDHISMEHILTGLGTLEYDQNNMPSALDYYKRALRMSEKHNGPENILNATKLNNVAVVLQKTGSYEEAKALHNRSMKIIEYNLGSNHYSMVKTLANLGTLSLDNRDFANALSYYDRALTILDKVRPGHPDKAQIFAYQAMILKMQNDTERAEDKYKKALELYESTRGRMNPRYIHCLSGIGTLYGKINKPEYAMEYIISSLTIQNEIISDLALWAPERTLLIYINGSEFYYDIYYSLLSKYNKVANQYSKKALDAHLAYKGKSIDVLSTRNRLTLFSKNEKIKEIIDELRYTTNKLSKLSLNPPATMSNEQFKELQSSLETKKRHLEEKLARGVSEYEEKRASDRISSDDIAASLSEKSVYIDFVEYNEYDFETNTITKEKKYLAFIMFKESANNTSIRIQDLGSAEKIDSLVIKLRDAIKKGTENARGIGGKRTLADNEIRRIKDSDNELNVILYNALLGYIDDDISRAKYLYISPAGFINLIPIEILKVPKSNKYLTDSIIIVYTSGRDLGKASVLRKRTEKDLGNKNITLIASPHYSNQKTDASKIAQRVESKSLSLSRGSVSNWPIVFEDLPGTIQEVDAIKKVANGEIIKLYVGSDATEENVKNEKRPRILHFATHGFFLEDVEASESRKDSRGIGGVKKTDTYNVVKTVFEDKSMKGSVAMNDPLLRSGLALTGANRIAENISINDGNEDGILTAAEVTGMDLYGTELVVLSACETGLGELQRGNGVFGLRRSFKIAGAQNMIMSLWSVPDEETRMLMEEFYRYYMGGAGVASSLNKARNELRKRLIERDGNDHPFYWAAFIYEGSDIQ